MLSCTFVSVHRGYFGGKFDKICFYFYFYDSYTFILRFRKMGKQFCFRDIFEIYQTTNLIKISHLGCKALQKRQTDIIPKTISLHLIQNGYQRKYWSRIFALITKFSLSNIIFIPVSIYTLCLDITHAVHSSFSPLAHKLTTLQWMFLPPNK